MDKSRTIFSTGGLGQILAGTADEVALVTVAPPPFTRKRDPHNDKVYTQA